jgi:two-component system response regulator DegU
MFKILLVEDNLNYRSILKSALLKRFIDMEAEETSGESDTLDVIDTYDPDLIFMDIDLENVVNGLDLTKKITSEHPEMVVVILSQYDTPEYRAVAKQNGADFFLSKNSPLKSVFDYVASIIERKCVPSIGTDVT